MDVRYNYWAVISPNNSDPWIDHIVSYRKKEDEELLDFLWRRYDNLDPDEDMITLCDNPEVIDFH